MRTESSTRQYAAARSAVFPTIAQRKRKYYMNQTASCDENKGRLFKVMDDLMEGRSDPMLPHSLSDADLVSFIFLKNITRIRRELDLDLCICVFSLDFDARPRMITTVL